MKEYLFRGKRVDNGEWVEGGSIINAQDGNIWIIPTNGIIQYTADSRKLVYVEAIPVVPETVCEFTGLTDKNGTKIFEGDIVRNNKYGEDNDTYDYYSTIFSNGSFRAQYLDNLKYTPKIYDIYFEGYQVIGNIHDNPELLREGE